VRTRPQAPSAPSAPAALDGLGAGKVERYGTAILAQLNGHAGETEEDS